MKWVRITGVLLLATTAQAQPTDAPFDQAGALASLRERIRGMESKPAGEVFSNLQVLSGLPASKLLGVMEVGFARSLGVNCTHCHVPGRWELDEKVPKRIARRMFGMMQHLNQVTLPQIPELADRNPLVNCTTCHRGETKPALDLPPEGSGP